MSVNVTLDDAYREACLALGEAIVRERLLTAELARRPEPPIEHGAFVQDDVDTTA